jgi:hypothetical protein
MLRTLGFRPPSSDIGVLNRIEKISYGQLYMKKEDENQMSSTG